MAFKKLKNNRFIRGLYFGYRRRYGYTRARFGYLCPKAPPDCICGGVPAQVIKFYWTIDQILEHESILYPESERFTREELEKIFAETKTKERK